MTYARTWLRKPLSTYVVIKECTWHLFWEGKISKDNIASQLLYDSVFHDVTSQNSTWVACQHLWPNLLSQSGTLLTFLTKTSHSRMDSHYGTMYFLLKKQIFFSYIYMDLSGKVENSDFCGWSTLGLFINILCIF